MSEPTPFLRVDGLTVAYGRQVAVDRLDLLLEEGSLLALLGPSGCGKTTTMRAIAGLLQPQSGTIVLAGETITRKPANRRGVGLVFQSYALFPHLSVFENVAFGLRLRKLDEPGVRSAAGEAIANVGLVGLERRLPKELSGGQQQRVALARALVLRPRLLLLDEPLSNLDARLRLEMRSELERLRRQSGTTMIYVTHDQSEALALADRVVLMRGGRIEQQGSPEEIWTRPATEFAARFMGFETILRREGDRLLAADGRTLPLSGAPAGRDALLAWRPRAIAVGEGPHVARVTGAAYLGERVEYLLDTAIGALKAEVAVDRPRFRPGETIAFDLPLATAVELPGGST